MNAPLSRNFPLIIHKDEPMAPVNRRNNNPPTPPLSPSSHQSHSKSHQCHVSKAADACKTPPTVHPHSANGTFTQILMWGIWPSLSCWQGGKKQLTHVKVTFRHYIPARGKDCQTWRGIVVIYSRLVKVWRVKRLRVSSHVSIEHVAVVQSERLPRLLVLGKVPARS